MPLDFDTFFQAATGHPPYEYQRRLACGEQNGRAKAEWLANGTACDSRLIDIPTGLGKTAAVALAWLWNRVALQRQDWPRRLVYCLPMRTLVEQTQGEVNKWIGSLLAKSADLDLSPDAIADLEWLSERSPVALMGGEDPDDDHRDWDIHPEKPAVLIGTQDMLLSRALNRGYGMARARWPMHFGLLNNDCLWVLDETQLMGVGVRTSAQLEGLRQRIGTVVGCHTWWASATLDTRMLATPDHRDTPPPLALDSDDAKNIEVAKRVGAIKHLGPLTFALTADSAKVVEPYLEMLADTVVEKHQAGTTTIVILNRVNRARDLFAQLDQVAKKQPLPERVLVHSRFRPMEREELSICVKASGEKIIIATQAIEAGVDISARTLITELAPWSSLVQRFGRCNRKGEFNESGGADILWVDLAPADEKAASALSLPYTPEQLTTARTLLQEAGPAGASPQALTKLRTDAPLPDSHILRRKDLIDLFDTTPDLAGLDIDVGRYIRDDEDRDVQVFWRSISDNAPDAEIETISPQRTELVRVALHEFRKFLEKNKSERRIWHWTALDGEWQVTRGDRVSPGQTYLVDEKLGGYSESLGWTGRKEKAQFRVLTVEDQPVRRSPRDGQDRDDESLQGDSSARAWQSIEEHTQRVVSACEEKISLLPAAAPWAEALRTSAHWHDVGKAHASFQTFISAGREIPARLAQNFIAKSPWKSGSKHSRPHFRHELASALVWLQVGVCDDPLLRGLIAYLIATHHGKIRLSIRAMPGEKTSEISADCTAPLFARGVWHHDKLPSDASKSLILAGVAPQPIVLDLSCMQMGEQNGTPSWTSRVLSLRDAPHLGLFRLAWLECILRAADAEGSRR